MLSPAASVAVLLPSSVAGAGDEASFCSGAALFSVFSAEADEGLGVAGLEQALSKKALMRKKVHSKVSFFIVSSLRTEEKFFDKALNPSG